MSDDEVMTMLTRREQDARRLQNELMAAASGPYRTSVAIVTIIQAWDRYGNRPEDALRAIALVLGVPVRAPTPTKTPAKRKGKL